MTYWTITMRDEFGEPLRRERRAPTYQELLSVLGESPF